MAKYPSQFATDTCVLSDEFFQALYGIWTEIGQPSYDYEFSNGIMEFESGVVGVKFEPTTRSAPLVCDTAMKRNKF